MFSDSITFLQTLNVSQFGRPNYGCLTGIGVCHSGRGVLASGNIVE